MKLIGGVDAEVEASSCVWGRGKRQCEARKRSVGGEGVEVRFLSCCGGMRIGAWVDGRVDGRVEA